MTVPVLETARLRLRGHRLDDFQAACRLWSDPLVTKYIGGKPSTQQQTWARLLAYLGHWSVLEYGYWAIEHAASRVFIGEVGFADFKRDIDPSMKDAPELGWALSTDFHGKGYGTEAVAAAIAWGDERFGHARTVCMISPQNLASTRVAAKCGYVAFKETTFNDRPTIFYERR
ncbi:MAG: GNAT family N-acetyltransferase [Candidatus Eremiobacteraeota bacterium]|nr:GNAT family N-acetyltransferase [Candidatus Eremiobacteraeota bacterium]MBC5803069.1 GNAT family N-acetyltransferase [Candidatus Eremiobacteraeota bacterium]MBC5820509.1 GNAT family N-acetyltransferase [Candidatus Eremiobacteraeota bacterium]